MIIVFLDSSKWSSGQVEQFCQTYQFFLPEVVSIFAQNQNGYIQLKSRRESFSFIVFTGETLKAVSTNLTTNFRGRSQINCEKLFCTTQNSSKDSSAHVECSFWQACQKIFPRSPNFLKYFYFSEKNCFLSHFFSRHVKCSFNNLAYL